jgi:hypothetical protein
LAANDDLGRKLKDGIDAARRGDRATARKLLEQVVIADENNELAWMWLASTVNTLSERRACLEKVLEINPNNARARDAIQQLGAPGRPAQQDQTTDQLRRIERATSPREAPPRRPTPPTTESTPGARRINPSYAIAIALIIISVVAVAAFGSAFLDRTQSKPTPTSFVQAVVPTAIPPADTPIPTAFIATTRTAPTLPPTYTPTFTPTATETPSPTATPYPLSNFLLLYTSLNPGDTEPGLFSINADGTGNQFLTASVRSAAIDPSGKKVAFVRSVTVAPDDRSPEGGTWPEIFVAPLDNLEAAVQITDIRKSATGYPSWGPDGVQIVFSSDFDGDEELWSMTDDGQNIRQLTVNDETIDREPAWSPDGKTIVFSSDLDSPGYTEIYSLSLEPAEDGTFPVTRLTNDAGSSYSPVWSQDGSKIAFISDRSGDGDVYVMDGDGQRPALLTFDDNGAEDRHPSFAPDGQRVAFISNREDGFFQVYLINLRGSDLVRVTDTGQDIETIVFRPDLLLGLR